MPNKIIELENITLNFKIKKIEKEFKKYYYQEYIKELIEENKDDIRVDWLISHTIIEVE